MSAHTPGPWLVGGRSMISQRITVYHRPFGLGDVAEVNHEDDARLIAAAPEMLHALQCLVGMAGEGMLMSERIEQARAAIAKATGGDDLDDAIEANGGMTWL